MAFAIITHGKAGSVLGCLSIFNVCSICQERHEVNKHLSFWISNFAKWVPVLLESLQLLSSLTTLLGAVLVHSKQRSLWILKFFRAVFEIQHQAYVASCLMFKTAQRMPSFLFKAQNSLCTGKFEQNFVNWRKRSRCENWFIFFSCRWNPHEISVIKSLPLIQSKMTIIGNEI